MPRRPTSRDLPALLRVSCLVAVLLLLSSKGAPAEELIAYDNDPLFTWSDLTQVGTQWAVRFTPLQSCTLSYCEVVSQGGAGPARLHLWLDDGFGYPAQAPILSKDVFLYRNLSYERVDFDPKIEIGSGDFHIGLEYTREPPPFIVADDDGGTEGRSKYKIPDEDWVVLDYNDLNIRAWVIYFEAEDLIPPKFIHADIPMGFTKEGDYLVEATITDASGIKEASLHYSISSREWTEVRMDSLGKNIYQGYIPAQEAGTEVSYYLSAVDNSPNQNVGYYPEAGSGDPIVFRVVEGWGVRYDDGLAESYFCPSPLHYDKNSCAVRMTPPIHPVQVSWCCAYVNSVQEFELAVYDDIAGRPEDVLAGPYRVNAVAPPEWINFEIALEERPTIGSGEFYIVMKWLPDSPEAPELGGDESEPDLRSLFRYGDDWTEWNSGDFMLRAGVTEIPEKAEDSDITALHREIYLAQNYPNPFNSRTEIEYFLNRDGDVLLEVFDLAGSLVATLQHGKQTAGKYVLQWNPETFASGIYFYRLRADGSIQTKKMILLK
jgi:hypothetical protein